MDESALVKFLRDNVPLFRGFAADKLRQLIQEARLVTFEPQEAVVEFGEEGDSLGVLLDGEAEVSVADDAGDRHRLGLLKPGDIFGEMSLMTGDKTTADVIGLTPCRALLISRALFTRRVITHPPAVTYLSKTIADRLKRFAYEEQGRRLAAAAFQRSEDPYGFRLKTDPPRRILVVNCGSSSLKYRLFDTGDEEGGARGLVERVGAEGTRHTCRGPGEPLTESLPRGDHAAAFRAMLAALTAPETGVLGAAGEVEIVAHRVVHGGDRYAQAEVVTDAVLAGIEEAAKLAPLHNPANLAGIRAARAGLPQAVNVAVFDTAFHQTMPPYAFLYGLPYRLYAQKKIRRYGFHGPSHAYVSLKAAEFLKRPFNELEIISCHLGNGASLCAIDHGRSVDTSMGFTPAEGLVMGTRCGDLDPAVLLHLLETEKMAPADLDRLINREGGLAGLSGISNDMREIEAAAADGHHQALLAFKTFCYRVRKYIGAYMAAMGGLDTLVFTGGIGQGSAGVRSLACQGLRRMGIAIDEERNRRAAPDQVTDIAPPGSPVKVLVIPTDEELMIARESLRAMERAEAGRLLARGEPRPVPLEISAHHVHLSPEHVAALFGPDHQLTDLRELSQPGQFACRETVNLIGPKGRVEKVRVLGPTRPATQVEISLTEQFKLGIAPPIRASGDLAGSPGLTLEGPAGAAPLEEGVICALRHIHLAPEDAMRFGLRDRDVVRVRVEGERELIFGDVLVRVSPKFKLAMHLDTDEANAAGLKAGAQGFIESVQARG